MIFWKEFLLAVFSPFFSFFKGCTDAYVCGIATDVCVGRFFLNKPRFEMSLSPKLENALNLE